MAEGVPVRRAVREDDEPAEVALAAELLKPETVAREVAQQIGVGEEEEGVERDVLVLDRVRRGAAVDPHLLDAVAVRRDEVEPDDPLRPVAPVEGHVVGVGFGHVGHRARGGLGRK